MKDPILLNAAQLNAWGKLRTEDQVVIEKIYELFQFIAHPEEAVDLAEIIPNFANEGSSLSEEQLKRYALCGLRVSRYNIDGHDDYWSRRKINGYEFDVCMDAAVGIGLLYKGKLDEKILNAFVSIMTEDADTLLVHEIHGVTGEKYEEEWKRLFPWGLEPLRWQELLVKIAKKAAQHLGYQRIGILSGHNNISVGNNGSRSLSLERAVEIYDGLAKSLGFVQEENKNWYRELN